MNAPHDKRPDIHVCSTELVLGVSVGNATRVSDGDRVVTAGTLSHSELLALPLDTLTNDTDARRAWQRHFTCTRGDHRNHDCEVLNSVVYSHLRCRYDLHVPDWVMRTGLPVDSPWTIMFYRLTDQQIGPWNGDNAKWKRVYEAREQIAPAPDRGYRALLNQTCDDCCLARSNLQPDLRCRQDVHDTCICRKVWAQKNHCPDCSRIYRSCYELAMNAADYALSQPTKEIKAALRSSVFVRQYFFAQPSDFGISSRLADALSRVMGLVRPDWARGPAVQTQSFFDTIQQTISQKFVSAMEAIKNTTTGLWDSIKNAVSDLFSWCFSALNSVAGFLKGIWDQTSAFFMDLLVVKKMKEFGQWIQNNPKKFAVFISIFLFSAYCIVTGASNRLFEIPILSYATDLAKQTVYKVLSAAGYVINPVKDRAVEAVAAVVGLIGSLVGWRSASKKETIEHLWNLNRLVICLGTGYYVLSTVLYMLPIAFQELMIDTLGNPTQRAKLAARRWMYSAQTLVKLGNKPELFTDKTYQKHVHQSVSDGIRLTQNGSLPRATHLNLQPWMTKLVRLEELISQAELGTQPRPVPWACHIAGPPGTFKTTLVRKFIEKLGYNSTTDTFYKSNLAQYWDGAATKKVCVMDEFMLSSKEMNEIVATEFISMVSGNPFYPNFASLDNHALGKKGDPYVGQVVFTINNTLNFALGSQDATAAARRFACKVEMTPRLNFGFWELPPRNETKADAEGGNYKRGSNFNKAEPIRDFQESDDDFQKRYLEWEDEKAAAQAAEDNYEMVQFTVFGCFDPIGETVIGFDAAAELVEKNYRTFWNNVNPTFPYVAKPADYETEYRKSLLESIGVYGNSWNPLDFVSRYLGKLIGLFTDADGAAIDRFVKKHDSGKTTVWMIKDPTFFPKIKKAPKDYLHMNDPHNNLYVRMDTEIKVHGQHLYVFGTKVNQRFNLNDIYSVMVEVDEACAADMIQDGWVYCKSTTPHGTSFAVGALGMCPFCSRVNSCGCIYQMKKFGTSARVTEEADDAASTVSGATDYYSTAVTYCKKCSCERASCECDTFVIGMVSEECPRCKKNVIHRPGGWCKCGYRFAHEEDQQHLRRFYEDNGVPDKAWSDEKCVAYAEKLAQYLADRNIQIPIIKASTSATPSPAPPSFCRLSLAQLQLFHMIGRNIDFDDHFSKCDECRSRVQKTSYVKYGSFLVVLGVCIWLGAKLCKRKPTVDVSADADYSTGSSGKYAKEEKRYDPYGSAFFRTATHAEVSTDAGAFVKTYKADICGLKAVIVPLDSNLFVANCHSFAAVKNDMAKIPLGFTDMAFSKDAHIARSHLLMFVDKDIALFRITASRMPGVKKIINKLPRHTELANPGTNVQAMVDYNSGMTLIPNLTFTGKGSYHPGKLNEVSKLQYNVTVDEMWVGSTGARAAIPGDSGTPVVCTTAGPHSGKMLGIHSTSSLVDVGGHEFGQVGIVPVWAEDVEIYLQRERSSVSTDALFPSDRAAGVHCPRKSKIQPSPFYGELEVEPTKQPAILSPIDPRAFGQDPLSLAAVRYDTVNDAIPDGMVLEMVADDFLQRIRPIFHGHVRRLTFEEAVAGLQHELSSINLTTSPGFPLQMFSVKKGKRDWVWFENGELKYREDFKELVLQADAAYQRGELLVEPAMVAYLKDELVSENKIKDLRTRLTYATDIVFYLVFRMNHGTIMAAFNQSWKEAPWKTGMNPASYDMDFAVRPAMGKKHKFAFDFKNFDASYNVHFQSYVYYIISTLAKMTPAQFIAFKRHETSPRVMIGKELYQAIFNHCSGICVTTFANCIMSALLLEYACVTILMEELDIGIKEAIRLFVEAVYFCNLGDDIWYATDIDCLVPTRVREVLARVGMVITSDVKDQPLTDEDRPLEDITFLGCYLRQVNGKWVGALKPEILYNTLQFTRDHCMSLENQVHAMVEAASIHDYELWIQYVERINRVIREKRLFDGREIDMDWKATRERAAARTAGSEFDFTTHWTCADDQPETSGGVNKILVPYTNEVEWPLAEWPLSSALSIAYDTQARDDDLILRKIIQWSDKQAAGTSLLHEALPGTMTSAMRLSAANKINPTAHKHRFSIAIEMTIDGNRFNRGKLRVVWTPLGRFANYIGEFRVDDWNPRYLTNTFLRADHGQRARLSIPWNFYYDFGLFDSLALSKHVLGHLDIRVESPLVVPAGANSTLDISVYMALIDHQHAVVRTDASLVAGAAADIGISMLQKALKSVKNDSYETDRYGTTYIRNVSLTAIDGPRPYRALERNSQLPYQYFPLETDTSFSRTSGAFDLHQRKTLNSTLAPDTMLWDDTLDCGVDPNLGQNPVYYSPTYAASLISFLSRFGIQYEFELQKPYATTMNVRVSVSFFGSSNVGRKGNPAAYTIHHTFTEDKWRFIVSVPFNGLTEYLYPSLVQSYPAVELSCFGGITLHSVSGLNDVGGTGAELLVWKRFVDFTSLEVNPASTLTLGNPAYIIIKNQPTVYDKTPNPNPPTVPTPLQKQAKLRFKKKTTDADEQMEGQLQESEARESEAPAVATDETQIVSGDPFGSNNQRFRIVISDWIHVARMSHNITQMVEKITAYSDLGGSQKCVLPAWVARPMFSGSALFGAWSGDLNYVITVYSDMPMVVVATPIMPVYQNMSSTGNDVYDTLIASGILSASSTLSRVVGGTPVSGVVNTWNYIWNITTDGIPSRNTRAGSLFVPPIEEKMEYLSPYVQQALVRVPHKHPLNYLPTSFDEDNRVLPFAWNLHIRPAFFNATCNLKDKFEVRCTAGDNFRYHQPRCVSDVASWVRVGTDVVDVQNFGNWERSDEAIEGFASTLTQTI